MFNRRFVPYLVVAGAIVLLLICYIGYRAYQKHLAFERFISNAQTFNRSVEDQHDHSSHNHTHHSKGSSAALKSDAIGQAKPLTSEHVHRHDKLSSRQIMQAQDHSELYAYEVNGTPIFSNEPLSQEDLVVEGWEMDGQMTPAVKEAFKKIKASSEDVIQRVVTPDGELGLVVAPRNLQYEEGDAILPAELEHGREAEQTLSKSEHDFSLSALYGPQLSEKPPVKVSFLQNDGYVGWMRKLQEDSRMGSQEIANSEEYPEMDIGSEKDQPLDVNKPLVYPDALVSPSDLPSMVESTPSRPSQSKVEVSSKTPTPPTVESIETQLREQLSPERFNQAQQLIDQYGTDGGLRRLREVDPEVAQQFEQEHLRSERLRSAEPSRDSPDGREAER